MDYRNGEMTAVGNISTLNTGTLHDTRLYLSEMTWDELEKYFKSISKRSQKNGHKITDQSNGCRLPDYPEG